MSAELDLIFDTAQWRQAPLEGSFKAMKVLPGTGPTHEVIRIVGTTAELREYRPLKVEFSDALQALEELDDNKRLGIGYSAGTPAIMDAVAALRRLTEAIQADHEDELDEEPTPLQTYLEDPPLLSADLAKAVETFTNRRLQSETRRLCTFSLILFREGDLGSEVARSLTNDRDQWRKALTPSEKTQPDTHLAVVPPPTASVAIEALASKYGCEHALPCVIFLGDRPKLGVEKRFMTRVSIRKLRPPPPSIPDQLETIYHSVYAEWIPWRGTPTAAAIDKFGPAIYRHIDTKVAVGLMAGAIGGSTMVNAVDLIFKLLHK